MSSFSRRRKAAGRLNRFAIDPVGTDASNVRVTKWFFERELCLLSSYIINHKCCRSIQTHFIVKRSKLAVYASEAYHTDMPLPRDDKPKLIKVYQKCKLASWP